MRQRTKLEKYKEILNLVILYGSVVVTFIGADGDIRRRRKITSDGQCIVSHLGKYSSKWSRWEVSCFIKNIRKSDRTAELTLKQMFKHDRGFVHPTEAEANGWRILL